MEVQNIIIAIDGYSSTGKSSFARLIAERLGLLHLDSGAIYRAITLHAIRQNLIDYKNHIDEDALLESLEDLKISLYPNVSIDNENVEKEIRQMNVNHSVSPISAIPFVRNYVDNLLREYGKKGGIVMDGRDIGSSVFPNANIKIFMTASVEARASRRYKEMIASGKQVKYEDVIKNIQERDYIDSHRFASPLKRADDAIILDNTNMTLEDQFVWLKQIFKEKLDISI